VKILVLNSGSSSVKYAVFEDEKQISNGLVERVEDHLSAIKEILSSVGEVNAVGHRVVHGGEKYKDSAIIDENAINTIRDLISLAPLHNGANLAGIEAVAKLYPDVAQVAVFDTSFHQSIPDFAYTYAIPIKFYENNKIRKYGFHGTSHKYITNEAGKFLNIKKENLNLITFHLGNGDSVCAVKNGQSFDTSMGFTPLEGLVMGTRSGDLDPQILIYLATQQGLSLNEIDNVLNKESGLKGICGSSDMRDIEAKAKNGDKFAVLALEIFVYRAKKYLGSYMASLGRVDAIVFAGGIGENSELVRIKILENLEILGVCCDKEKNKIRSRETFEINTNESKIKILVIHTDEEKEIAKQTMKLVALR
jgi:acetate kinase